AEGKRIRPAVREVHGPCHVLPAASTVKRARARARKQPISQRFNARADSARGAFVMARARVDSPDSRSRKAVARARPRSPRQGRASRLGTRALSTIRA